LGWLDDEESDWARRGLARRLVVRETGLINFGANDYLGLAADPRVIDAARKAAGEFGWGAGASPLVSGWSAVHQALAEELADFEQAEAVALFPTGYAANLGTIAALV